MSRRRRDSWDFSSTKLTASGQQALWQLCEGNGSLRTLILSNSDVGSDCPLALHMAEGMALTKLNLSGNELLGPTFGVALGRALGSGGGTLLAELYLRSTGLAVEGVKAIASALAQHDALRVLDISHNRAGREGCSALAKMLRVNEQLRQLAMEGMAGSLLDEKTTWLIGSALLENPRTRLRSLSFDSFAVDDDPSLVLAADTRPADVVLLAGVLKANSSLQSLTIPHGCVGKVDGKAATDAKRALQALAQSLHANVGLARLCLSGAALGEGAAAVGDALLANRAGRLALINVKELQLQVEAADVLSIPEGLPSSMLRLHAGRLHPPNRPRSIAAPLALLTIMLMMVCAVALSEPVVNAGRN